MPAAVRGSGGTLGALWGGRDSRGPLGPSAAGVGGRVRVGLGDWGGVRLCVGEG